MVGRRDAVPAYTPTPRMKFAHRAVQVLLLFVVVIASSLAAVQFGSGSLWRGFSPALAVTGQPPKPYDLTRLEAVNETLDMIRKRYVDPARVKPKQMLLSALNYVQRDVAQVVVKQDKPNEVVVQVENESKSFRVDNVQGPWDVAARLREVFGFLQKNLKGTDVDLRLLEYAACNGMLHTLDPHSVFLSPEGYKEMNVQTSGAFGGLGIVIAVRDDQLTVMRPMPNTPASKAGLKRFDRIVKIEGESTLNMPIDDAVRRLRGEPGSKVTIWVTREPRDGQEGFSTPRPFELGREVIKVQSVEARLLDGNVGYIKLKSFQQSSTDEVDAALADFKKNGPMKGLVLDLRGNPGGLLEQSVKIADKFIHEGTLVATVGASEGRDERKATAPGTEPDYPIVVLVSGSSASASEILSGALKNLDRSVTVGQQTFGKGSVQLVFPEVTPDKAALKLTISQYLTPGDVSIQGVGVTPDIELDPMTVDDLEMDLTVQKDGLREKELFASLDNDRAAPPGRPETVVRYQFTSAERETLRELGGDADDDFRMDFPIRFSRELAAALPSGQPRLEQLRSAAGLLEKVKRDELAKVAAELSHLGVDWAAAPDGAPTGKPTDLDVRLETGLPGDEVNAGAPMELKVTVKNNGDAPVYRLRAATESETGYFDAKELAFGKIAPGQEKTAKVPFGFCDVEGRKVGSTAPRPKNAKRACKIPMDALERSEGVTLRFEADGGPIPAPREIRPIIKALPRPTFKYAYDVVDDRGGNGDGRIQTGEKVSMYLTVKNIGPGRSFDTQATITNMSGDALLLHDGRFDISNMNPGDVRRVRFSFDVASKVADSEVVVAFGVRDRDLNEASTEKVRVPIELPLAVTATSGTRKAGDKGVVLLDAPRAAARGFGKVAPGTALTVLGRVDGFEKIRLDDARFAFARSDELADAGTGTPSPTLAFDDLYVHAPPELELKVDSLATRGDTNKLKGIARGNEKLMDLYGFVGQRKFLYRSNRTGDDPKSASFEADVPLRPGTNVIYVVARESTDATTRRVIVVRKDGATALCFAPRRTSSSSAKRSTDPIEGVQRTRDCDCARRHCPHPRRCDASKNGAAKSPPTLSGDLSRMARASSQLEPTLRSRCDAARGQASFLGVARPSPRIA